MCFVHVQRVVCLIYLFCDMMSMPLLLQPLLLHIVVCMQLIEEYKPALSSRKTMRSLINRTYDRVLSSRENKRSLTFPLLGHHLQDGSCGLPSSPPHVYARTKHGGAACPL
jgi:hypothetical protein